MNIDLNCDMGENIGNDEAIMPYITSANIACGFHAGDAKTMQATVRLAKKYGVAVGAHPSWLDVEGFGRREMTLPPDEVEALILYQLGALSAIAKAEGVELVHVKPHGALYNQAAKDKVLANAIARAVKGFSVDLVLVGLAGSGLIEAGLEAGLRVPTKASQTGTTIPMGRWSHVKKRMRSSSRLKRLPHMQWIDSKWNFVWGKACAVDTLCLHGDHPRAAENAQLIREALAK